MEQKKSGKAVVIGGSIGGMLAARALADHFEKVVIVERDNPPKVAKPRRKVPQDRHIHVLLQSGQESLEKYFPGILEELETEGLNIIDSGLDIAWHHFGVWKKREETKLPMVLCMRYFLEHNVRQRMLEVENVEFKNRTVVDHLLTNEAQDRVTGLMIRGAIRHVDRRQELHADLVVDASGRGSHMPHWLEEMGYKAPDKESFGIDLAYTSRMYRPPKNWERDFKIMVTYPRPPEQHRAGFISCVEKDLWCVSLNGYFGDHAPREEDGFLEFATKLPTQDIYDRIKDATPVSDIQRFVIPEARRYHYEKLRRFPEGVVVLGDAFCVLNPVFGQGMSIAALESVALGEEIARLRRKRGGSLDGLAKRFFKRASGIVALPWLVSTTEDLRFAQTTGKRSVIVDFLNLYKSQLLELCSTNAHIQREFLKLVHMKNDLPSLLLPAVSLPAIWHGLKSIFLSLPNRANTDRLPKGRTWKPRKTKTRTTQKHAGATAEMGWPAA